MQGPDAFGLGLFAARHQDRARASMPPIVAVLDGHGDRGVRRCAADVVCNRFRASSRPPAVRHLCVSGGWLVVLAQAPGAAAPLGLVAGAALAVLLRLLAMAFNWKLPAWRQE
jgi:uncharacterized membrane protein YeiH